MDGAFRTKNPVYSNLLNASQDALQYYKKNRNATNIKVEVYLKKL